MVAARGRPGKARSSATATAAAGRILDEASFLALLRPTGPTGGSFKLPDTVTTEPAAVVPAFVVDLTVR